MEAFEARCLPLRKEDLDPSVYMEALIDATARLEVYKTKLASSKLDQNSAAERGVGIFVDGGNAGHA